jgi:hypothetical protein
VNIHDKEIRNCYQNLMFMFYDQIEVIAKLVGVEIFRQILSYQNGEDG